MSDLFYQSLSVSRSDKEKLLGHKSFVVWLTGLSGAGKTTIAKLLVKKLHDQGINTQMLDGDNTRLGINKDLGFSEFDRNENLRRVAELSKLFIDSGNVVIAAFISPLETQRKMIRHNIGNEDFLEVFVDCPLEQCELRDVKGLYKKARAGEIADFTGISSPYEIPENADLIINSKSLSPEECVSEIFELIVSRF
jgi:adenylylsulfate kinase